MTAFAATSYAPDKCYMDDCFNKKNVHGCKKQPRMAWNYHVNKSRKRKENSGKEKRTPDYVRYEKKARDHAALQESMKEELIDTLNRQNQRSLLSLQKVALTLYPSMNLTWVDNQTHT